MKSTELDKEIQEALFDPKKSISQITAKEWSAKKKHGYTLIKNGQKYILRLDKGKTVLEPVKVFDPKTKGKGTMTQEFKEREEAMLRIWNELNSPKYQKIAKQLKKERAKGYDPKQSHVYKVGWKAKTGFKVKSFWTKAEMDKQIAILKKAGIWYRAWQAGTDKVYDPKASVVPVRWYEAMVKGIKKSSDVRNPYVTVKSIWAKLSPSKRAEFRAREKKGERFKYDLPLPVDKPTKGTGTVRMVKPFKLAEVQVNLSIKDYLAARASGLFQKMKREDGTTALVSRCKSPKSNTNIFIDKMK